MKLLRNKPYLFWLLIGAIVYIPFLGSSQLFDWDEINFAESAREMMVSGDYLTVQINFQPFWEKPPIFMWLQVLSFSFSAPLRLTLGLPWNLLLVFQMPWLGSQLCFLFFELGKTCVG